VRSPFAQSPEFVKLLQRDPGADLTRIALEIARDEYPDLDPEVYLEKIVALADRVRDRCPAGARPRQILGHVNWVLFVEEGFKGNTEDYGDPRNSYLNEVIDRRTGIPISLSLLYRALAGRLGLELSGVNLPAHFLLRVGRGTSTIFIDPFHSGALLDRAGCERCVSRVVGQSVALSDLQLAPCSPAQVVSRMLRNLKAIYFQRNEFMLALPVQRRLAAVELGEPEEQRDLGMLCLQVDRPGDAVGPLEAYLQAQPEAADAEVVGSLLRAARREVARWN
jgi:regulator of sirC expression with transglutaminase-like and TPR domain